MKRALINTHADGLVVQVVEVGEEFRTHSALQWRDCPDTVTPGHRWDGADFEAPEAPSVEPPAQSRVDRLIEVLESKGVITRADLERGGP